MPSGVSQVASATPRPVASLNALAQSSRRGRRRRPAQLDGPKSGIPLMRPSLPAARGRSQHGERVAAGEHVAVDAVDRQVRLAGQPHRVAPAAFSSAASAGGGLGVVLVGAADAGDRRPRLGERRRRRPRTASRGRPPGTGCRRTWPGRCAGRSGRSWPGRPAGPARRPGVGGRAAPRTPARPGPGAARRTAGPRRRLAVGQLLGQVGELADAGDRVLAGGAAAAARASHAAAIRSRTSPSPAPRPGRRPARSR